MRATRSVRGATPRGFLGMLAIVVVVELTIARGADRFRDWMGFTWSHAARASRREAVDADVLILGDSLIKEGLIARSLTERLGRPAYNLAVHGGSAPTTLHILERALSAGARPNVIIVDFHPNLLSSTPKSTSPHIWGELLGPLDMLALGWEARDAQLVVRALLASTVPSVRLREGIRGEIVAALSGEERTESQLRRALERQFQVNRGSRVQPARAPRPEQFHELRMRPEVGRWKPNRANLSYLHRFLERATRLGATVVWLWPPASPEWDERRERIGAEAAYERLAREVQARHPGVLVLDGRRSGYGHGEIYDVLHLHVGGASALTRDVAEFVRPLLDAPRTARAETWFQLPRFEPVETSPGVEDVNQSRVALGIPPIDFSR